MKRNQGFTLIELMIVVAIIGILLGVVVPACSHKPNPDSHSYSPVTTTAEQHKQ